MSPLTIETKETAHGDRVVVLNGPLTLNTLFEFQSEVRKQKHAGLIIDLAQVPYIDSAGLGAILGAFASCQNRGDEFGLAGVSQRVLTIMQVAHVDSLVPRYETIEKAQEHFAAKS
jgi:anti-sigma B factor antagonist